MRLVPIVNQDPGDESDADAQRWIREVRHGISTELPPRMPAPMSREELGALSTSCFRLQGELARRSEVFGPEWAEQSHSLLAQFHGLVLALMTVNTGHSVKV